MRRGQGMAFRCKGHMAPILAAQATNAYMTPSWMGPPSLP